MSVPDPMGLVGRSAKAGFPVRFIFGIVPVEPDGFALTLKGKDMGSDPVKEPPVMADHEDTPGKVEKRLFQGAHRIDIQVIRRLIKKEHIGPLFKDPRQVNPVSLAP